MFDDDSTAEIRLIYGYNIRDFWFRQGEPAPSNKKVAWTGDNPWAKTNGCKIRLYEMVLINSKPQIEITEIELVGSARDSVAAPICIAISINEEK